MKTKMVVRIVGVLTVAWYLSAGLADAAWSFYPRDNNDSWVNYEAICDEVAMTGTQPQTQPATQPTTQAIALRGATDLYLGAASTSQPSPAFTLGRQAGAYEQAAREVAKLKQQQRLQQRLRITVNFRSQWASESQAEAARARMLDAAHAEDASQSKPADK